MKRRSPFDAWARLYRQNVAALTRATVKTATRTTGRAMKTAVKTAVKSAVARHAPPSGPGDWLSGMAFGPTGVRRYHLYRPPGTAYGERLPLVVMLHGCAQDATAFAKSTNMNRLAARERFFVLYPEQDRTANANNCWNWFETRGARHHAEAASIVAAIDQVCLLYPVDRTRVAVAGLSAGASMAGLLAQRYPNRFAAVAMHSGVPPGHATSAASALRAMRGARTTSTGPGLDVAAGVSLPPLLVVHGTRDTVVSARNAHAAVAAWAHAAGAEAAVARVVKRGRRRPATMTDYRAGGAVVATLVEVDGLGHAWSGGSAKAPFGDPLGPDVSRLVWRFARRAFAVAGRVA